MKSTDAIADADAGERDRYVFVELPRCTRCQSTRHHVYGHGEAQDALKVQYAQCLNEECGHRFKIIWE